MISNFLIVFLLFLLFIYVPGFLLFNIIFKNKKDFTWIELAPLFFVFGLVFFAIIGFPTYLFHFSHTVFLALFCGVTGVLLLINIYLFITKKRDFILESAKYSVWITALFVLLALLILILCFPSVDIGGDRWSHIGIMRRLAISDLITPYFNLFKDVPSKIDSGYGYNIWHLAGSMIFRSVSLDPNVIWEYLIIILAPLQILSFGFLARKLIKNNLFYFLALTIFFIFAGVLVMGWEWRLSPYPDQIARNVVIPVVLGLWLLFLKREKIDKGILLGIVFLGATLLLIHMFSVIYFLIAIGGMIIFSFLTEKKYQIFKKGFFVLVAWLIISAPILYFQYLAYLQVVPTNFGSASYKTINVGKFFIVNPEIWQSSWTIAAAVIAILLLLIWQLIKKRKIPLPILFCFVLIFFAVLMSFVPPIATFVGKIITSTFLARLASIIPIPIILALLLFELVKNNKTWARIAVVILIIILIDTVYAKKTELKVQIAEKTNRWDTLSLENITFYEYVNKNIPYSAVIAANPDISYRLFIYSNNYLVMIPQAHCPAIIAKRKRLDDLNTMLNPNLAIQNKSLFEKYQVDYIVSGGTDADGFKKYPQLLTEIYNNNMENLSIFKINH